MGMCTTAHSRCDAGPGIWCSLLIPISFITNSLLQHETRIYTEVCVVSIGLLVSSLCWMTLKWERNLYFSIAFNIFCLFLSYLIASTLVGPTSYSMLLYFLVSYSSIWLCSWICSNLLSTCPSSFTYGEAIVVSQGCTLFLLSFFLSMTEEVFKPRGFVRELILDSSRFSQVLLFGCMLLLFIVYMFPCLQHTCSIYIVSICVGGLSYAVWNAYLGNDPVLWLLSFSFDNSKRVLLILFWLFLVCLSVLFVVRQNERGTSNVSTIVRKFFHIAIILVYIPGVLWDPELLYLASSMALAVFLVLELMRLLKLFPFGPIIDHAFKVFLDEKDAGSLILTHIYLLIGCSCPLWLYSQQFNDKGYHICLMSGIISVGVGDTAASIGGSFWGKHKWPGSKKTVEGTVFAIVTQLICIVPFLLIDISCMATEGFAVLQKRKSHVLSAANLMIAVLGVVLTSLLEAKTVQVDNLILPLFLFSILSLIN